MPATEETKRHTAAIVLAPRLQRLETATLVELEKLLNGLGITVIDQVIQRSTPLGSPHLIGSGKLQELEECVKRHQEEAPPLRDLLLVVAADISPSEQRTLEKAVDIPVLDRSAVILRVFEARAQTALARLEVGLARARYELPRVRDDESLGDKEGGGGRAARGHTNVEIRKQLLRRSITDFEARIRAAERSQDVQKKARQELSRVALVGYTNAGKSSLLRALCQTDVYVADELFATLSTSVRSLPRTTPPVLVSDTVGFMRALPHDLLRSFRSTLREAVEANLRLIVVDGSDPDFGEHLEVTRGVLGELGADEGEELLVFNKADRLDDEALAALRSAYPGALFVSAHQPESVETLRARILEAFDERHTEVTVVVPFAEGRRLARLHAETRVVSEQATENGVEVRVRASTASLARLGLVAQEGQGH